MSGGLLQGMVACDFGLLGFQGSFKRRDGIVCAQTSGLEVVPTSETQPSTLDTPTDNMYCARGSFNETSQCLSCAVERIRPWCSAPLVSTECAQSPKGLGLLNSAVSFLEQNFAPEIL